MSELKPCPFCGHKPLSYVQTGVIACCYSMCGVNPSCDNAGAWNGRVNDEELERLRSERDELVSMMSDLISAPNGFYTGTGETTVEMAIRLLEKLEGES